MSQKPNYGAFESFVRKPGDDSKLKIIFVETTEDVSSGNILTHWMPLEGDELAVKYRQPGYAIVELIQSGNPSGLMAEIISALRFIPAFNPTRLVNITDLSYLAEPEPNPEPNPDPNNQDDEIVWYISQWDIIKLTVAELKKAFPHHGDKFGDREEDAIIACDVIIWQSNDEAIDDVEMVYGYDMYDDETDT